jgi:hypothetical protein
MQLGESMTTRFRSHLDITQLSAFNGRPFAIMATLLLAFASYSGNLLAETSDAQDVPANPCFSTDPTLGDSAFWASTAVQLFAQQKYKAAVATVDACFNYWGPRAGQAQKKLHDNKVPYPPTGKVSAKIKEEIGKDYLINDVSMALWAKSRSLHELKKIDLAKQSYAQCLYMMHGRAWDPNGWFWSPAEDCAVYARKLARK